MPSTHLEIPAEIRYIGHAPKPAVALVRVHDRPARTARAAKAWLATWGFAIAAVFIPLLHFVLVPALVIAGPLLGMARLAERATLVRVTGACPACDRALALAIKGKLVETVPFRCEGCGRPLELAPDRARLAELGLD